MGILFQTKLASLFWPILLALAFFGAVVAALILLGLLVLGVMAFRTLVAIARGNAPRRSLQPIAATKMQNGGEDSADSPQGKLEGTAGSKFGKFSKGPLK